MKIINAAIQTVPLKEDSPSLGSAETFDRTSSIDGSSSIEECCDRLSTLSFGSKLQDVKQGTTTHEEKDDGINLIFGDIQISKRGAGTRQRGRSRRRRNWKVLPTNASAVAFTRKGDKEQHRRTKKEVSIKKKDGKLRRVLNTSLRSMKGEIERMQRTRTQEMLVIHPVGTFEMNQELAQKKSNFGL